MKKPIGFKVFGGFLILFGISFFFNGFGRLIDNTGVTYSTVIISTLFFSLTAWTIITIITWFFELKNSYLILILNIISTTVLIIAANYRIFSQDNVSNSDLFLAATVLFFFGIYLLFMIIYASMKSTRIFINKQENRPKRSTTTISIIIFLMIFLIPVSVILFLQEYSYNYQTIECRSITSSGDYGEYSINNIYDDDLKTWWTPQNHHGRNAWIKFKFYGYEEVAAIRIHPGSHYPDYKNIGDLFLLNGRLLKAKLIFSDGSIQTIQIEDKDELQIIELNPKHINEIILKVITTARGKKWDDLCISEAQILRKTTFFNNN